MQDDNLGFAAGNRTLDGLLGHFVDEANDCFINGLQSPQGKFFLVFVRLEGDLPAQGKLMHSARNFTNEPNPMCPWCLADDRNIPFADHRRDAVWRTTTGSQKPWGSCSPLHRLPGGDEEEFVAKDLFHISQLGITRTFVASCICYLVDIGHFTAGHAPTVAVPVRLKEAYECFKDHCRLVQRETPDVKAFSRENLGWKSRNTMPETSWQLGLIWQLLFSGSPTPIDTSLHMS